MYQVSTRDEILELKSQTSELLAEGFEARYGRVKIFKDLNEDKYSLVKDINTNDFRLINTTNKYLRFKSVCQTKNLSQIEAVTSHRLDHGVMSMTVVLEYFPYDLQQDIASNNRHGRKVIFGLVVSSRSKGLVLDRVAGKHCSIL